LAQLVVYLHLTFTFPLLSTFSSPILLRGLRKIYLPPICNSLHDKLPN